LLLEEQRLLVALLLLFDTLPLRLLLLPRVRGLVSTASLPPRPYIYSIYVLYLDIHIHTPYMYSI